MEGDGLTMDSVAKMSTYDLRQEVERRGLLEDVNPVNHNTLLRRVVQILVEEEHERGRQSAEPPTVGANSAAGVERANTSVHERMRLEKEKRKEAALERSKQRQADQEYFRQKKTRNVRPERPEEDTSPDAGDEDMEEAVSNVNPRRYKVFVR